MIVNEIFSALVRSTRSSDIRSLLHTLGDHSGLELDEPFGPFNWSWHPVGDDVSNFSTVGVATKPGRSLTERVTNADDAILERLFEGSVGPPPLTPRQAAKRWMGRPASNPSDGLFKWDFKTEDWDRKVHVAMIGPVEEGRATIDVIDAGIGIPASMFAQTILSIHGKNKIKKKYLVGTFGQGGASTLGFCDYCAIFSRPVSDARIGFTIIKLMELRGDYKEDSYVYLTSENAVPSVAYSDAILRLYDSSVARSAVMSSGTVVRHFGYNLTKLSAALGPMTGNLYHYLNCSLFDPIIPFRLLDLRDEAKDRDEIITGSRNRLMKLTLAESDDELETGSVLKLHRRMEFVAVSSDATPTIGIEYWVVFNYRKTAQGGIVLRPKSNELYVQPNYPIVFSLHGQNQGELSGQFLRDRGLELLSRHMVVHVDATACDAATRKGLFATTREALKDGPILESLLHVLGKMLDEDERLFELEKELTDQLVNKEIESTEDEVKKQVAELLREAGLELTRPATVAAAGRDDRKQRISSSGGGSPITLPPLPTLPYPQVTFFNIVRPEMEAIQVERGDSIQLSVETDADAQFDVREFIQFRCSSNDMYLAAKSPLGGGRMRFRMRVAPDAEIGAQCKVIATLTRPGGAQIVSERSITIVEPKEKGTSERKGKIPPFEILFISPDEQLWEQIWPDYTAQVDQSKVAYRAVRSGNTLHVYVSSVFPDYADIVRSLTAGPKWRLSAFNAQYKIWVGYHAIVQDQSKGDTASQMADGDADRVLEIERSRVAKMQARQALRTADLQGGAAGKG